MNPLYLKKQFPENFFSINGLDEDNIYFFDTSNTNGRIMFVHNQIAYIIGLDFKSFDLKQNKIICQCNGHSGSIYTTIKLNNESRIATSSSDGTMKIWDPYKGLVISLGNDSSISFYAMCQLSNGDIVGSGYKTGIRFYDIVSGNLKRTITDQEHKHPSHIYYLNSPSNNILVTGCSKMIKVWKLEEWELIKMFDIGIRIMGMNIYKEYFIFKDYIFNYLTEEKLYVKNEFSNNNGDIITKENNYYCLYSFNRDTSFNFSFNEIRMISLMNISFRFQ